MWFLLSLLIFWLIILVFFSCVWSVVGLLPSSLLPSTCHLRREFSLSVSGISPSFNPLFCSLYIYRSLLTGLQPPRPIPSIPSFVPYYHLSVKVEKTRGRVKDVYLKWHRIIYTGVAFVLSYPETLGPCQA
ncbi:hypothetical protein L211DRAFT_483644 [Terfezia boudieri ATCC MYA-4762]|uniref:Uncharacterized protein n=1 Tax=Terfezia boudieri ATCC MYA-4762 TaxID=1051890 RepID=A0A3N4LYW9_9PEZI|nr:hypothetical protein L211DRAFT_483644 [Terfezia boudieri ATCC MYA-4762]